MRFLCALYVIPECFHGSALRTLGKRFLRNSHSQFIVVWGIAS